jgi:membrane protein YqaA with SNARE-associated domain
VPRVNKPELLEVEMMAELMAQGAQECAERSDFLANEATSAFTVRCNLVSCAYSFLSMLSEGSAVLLSRHDTSLATRLESFSLGRTFTDRLMCPFWTQQRSSLGARMAHGHGRAARIELRERHREQCILSFLSPMLLSALQARRRSPNKALAAFRHLGAFGLFVLAILDGTPLPTFGGPDILLVILVLSRRNPWYEYTASATAGAVIGAYLTFRLARGAGKAYLDKFSGKQIPKLLKLFDRWGLGLVIASSAIPFPLPTSLFFAAAGASGRYHAPTFLGAVAVARGLRYTCVALVAHLYGRHAIRVLRHPTQYWGWLILFSAIFVLLIATGVLINRRVAEA